MPEPFKGIPINPNPVTPDSPCLTPTPTDGGVNRKIPMKESSIKQLESDSQSTEPFNNAQTERVK